MVIPATHAPLRDRPRLTEIEGRPDTGEASVAEIDEEGGIVREGKEPVRRQIFLGPLAHVGQRVRARAGSPRDQRGAEAVGNEDTPVREFPHAAHRAEPVLEHGHWCRQGNPRYLLGLDGARRDL